MSVVHNKLRDSSEVSVPRGNWFVRIADGSIYGPVTDALLREWAAQRRIVAGDEVSEDRQSWIPAQQLPDLQIEWNAEFPNGETQGPFHLDAIPRFIEDGTLPHELDIVNRLSGERRHIRGAPARGAERHPDAPAAIQQELAFDNMIAPAITIESVGASSKRKRKTRPRIEPEPQPEPTPQPSHTPDAQPQPEQDAQPQPAPEPERDSPPESPSEPALIVAPEPEQRPDTESPSAAVPQEDMSPQLAQTAAALESARAELAETRRRVESLQQRLRLRETENRKNDADRQVFPRFSQIEDIVKDMVTFRQIVAILLVALLSSVSAFLIGARFTTWRHSRDRRVQPPAAPSARLSAKTRTPPKPTFQQPRAGPANPLPGPHIDLPGVQPLFLDNDRRITFENGLFSSMLTLSDEAVRLLEQLAQPLRDLLAQYTLVIEGHTDDTPPHPRTPFQDNKELGLARAEVVLDLLVNRFQLPARAISVASSGSDTPPYPNDTPENRRRNRTVVLIFHPRPP